MSHLLTPLIVHGCLESLQGMLRRGHEGEDRLSHLLDAGSHQVRHVVVTGLEESLQLLGWLHTQPVLLQF